jgi:hypothetical protein
MWGERDADHFAAASGRNEGTRGDGVRHQPGAFEVQPDHRPEALGRDVLGGRQELTPGIVYEQIDLPVTLEHLVDQRVDLGLLANITRDRFDGARGTKRNRLTERLEPPPAGHYCCPPQRAQALWPCRFPTLRR